LTQRGNRVKLYLSETEKKMIMKEIARLGEKIKRRGISVVARETGYTRPTLYKITRGEKTLNLEIVINLIKYFEESGK